ncbi:alpha,alpha-trehalase [Catalinimonas alkaloidigena]|uniref:Alpha,alpha-trehalase n=1 Tax=Catalinimonas alkaloidigena TaxID=1075417 RepID=A0A1G9ULP5_9BACT|nr:alpha,alpha-trehalase TreF [Catalinimonas alkaloidigena]SDM60754.1 alpha,alpha-trehalase [Catalinimonas alkaloidigena]
MQHHLFRTLVFWLFSLSLLVAQPSEIRINSSADLYSDLFNAVQMSRIFPDSKTFADAIPKEDPEQIRLAYQRMRRQPDFSLLQFVNRYFIVPEVRASDFTTDTSRSVQAHINALWPVLTRKPDSQQGSWQQGGSLIPLPHEYVVPGGRFREVYYWDSYFTMLGLQASGREDLIRSMLDNFAYLIKTVGFIPNGNRTYYRGRSQPPFFAAMVRLLAASEGDSVLLRYLSPLETEYQFWMDGRDRLTAAAPAYRRVVRINDTQVLNRYWDDYPAPRPESYREDVLLAREVGGDSLQLWRDLRAGAESGWDFSSRWFRDHQHLATIHTTEILPVDLNALLYNLEMTLARAHQLAGHAEEREFYLKQAQLRSEAVRQYFWHEDQGVFLDYDFVAGQPTGVISAATLYPLFFGMVTSRQARAVAKIVRRSLLQPGGVLTTVNRTGQQWDAPNGWAPLQWIAIRGLEHYGEQALADRIRTGWTSLNVKVYEQTGKLVEKYNLLDTGLEAGGGEYPLQDGFGWTNGVLLRLLEDQEKR